MTRNNGLITQKHDEKKKTFSVYQEDFFWLSCHLENVIGFRGFCT